MHLSERIISALMGRVLSVLSAIGLHRFYPPPLDVQSFEALYRAPLPLPDGPRKVFHLGHSLVGRDMPAMLAQLSGAGHDYASQLGWGAPLKSHWDPDVPINGFAQENAHTKYRDAHEAVGSGDYDALVLTEMVEIKAAIRYQDSARMLFNWADKAQAAGMTVFFYETWHELDCSEGWRYRLDRDLGTYWVGQILRPALALLENPKPIYLIPGGQVMAAIADTLEMHGPVGALRSHRDLFSDEIHFNDYGAYLVALTHYAVLYRQSPVGLPHALLRADGTAADDPGGDAAAMMQRLVWDVVRGMPRTGVASLG